MTQLVFTILVAGGVLLCGLIIGLALGILFIAPRFYHFNRIARHADYVARLDPPEQYVKDSIMKLTKSIYHHLLNQDYEQLVWPEK